MKPQTIKINIEDPCHENWDKMLEEEKARPDGSVGRGKFCLACQKTVVDFSKMTNAQIIDYLNNTPGKICGRVAKHQLNTPISNYTVNKTPFFNKYVAGFLMALGFYHPAKSQTPVTPTEIHKTVGEIAVRPNVPANKKLVIKGRVIDAKTKKAIIGANINIVGSELNVVSDKNGHYTINVPTEFQNASLELMISALGFETFYVSGLDYQKTELTVTTKMQKEIEHLKGDIMIMGKIAPSR
jgi:hypothetical protein